MIVRDKYGVKLKYPNRNCDTCQKYPCFEGIKKCRSNFAKNGCKYYLELKNKDPINGSISRISC